MIKKRIAMIVLIATLTSTFSPAIIPFAYEIHNVKETSDIGENGEISSLEVEAGIADVSIFNLNTNAEIDKYNEQFKMNNSNIKSIETNGGSNGNFIKDNMIDGNLKTLWETKKANSDSFTNEIIFNLEDVTTLNRMIYAVRQDGHVGLGFPEEFEIYTSKTSTGDEFSLVSTGGYEKTASLIEIKFKPTEFKRIKFVFKKANGNLPSVSEAMFYKEDVISDKMARLFTDDSLSVVSQEFNTVELINELEEEVKGHPLYNDFKTNIEDAKILINNNLQDSDSRAEVSKFTIFNNSALEDYNNKFKMDVSNIKSIKSNGGNYPNSAINKAIDGDFNTHWETGKPNSESFTNEVEFELNELTTLNRIVYKGRNGGKGFAKEFEIYGSKTTKGETFNLITTGAYTNVNEIIEIKFKATEFKRIKFRFKNANENWASAAEFSFYKEDELTEKINSVFTDGTMSAISEEFNSQEAVNNLIDEINNHPLVENYKYIGELAKDILASPDKYENTNTIIASQRGDQNVEARKRGINSGSYSLDVFGKYVVPGETIRVYVDADKNGVMPQLILGQMGNDIGGWVRSYTLKPGLNEITAPEAGKMSPAGVYISNSALPKDQEYAPRIRLEGGTAYPVYYHGKTNPQDFRKELEEYNKKVSINDEDFNNGPREDVVYNISELVSENVTIATSAKGALQGLKEIDQFGEDVSKAMDDWETMYEDFQLYSGFDANSEDERFTPYPAKMTNRVFSKGAHAWAAAGYVGYNGGGEQARDNGFYKGIVKPFNRSDNWANSHEWGHKYNSSRMVHGEVSNNLYAQRTRRIFDIEENRVPWDYIFTRFSGEKVNMGHFENLGVLTQVEAYFGEDLYPKASRLALTEGDKIFEGINDGRQRLMIAFSIVSGYDLLDFTNGWNYVEITDKMRERVAHLPKLDAKIEYLDDTVYKYKGEGFTDAVKPEITNITRSIENKTNTIEINIDEENKQHLLGYEIYRDGELVGYTRKNTFVDKNIDETKNYTYKIVAFDKKLCTINSEEVKLLKPLMGAKDSVTLKLNTEFNPMDYVKAFTYDGQDISTEVVVKSNNVNTSKKGMYEIVYEVINNDSIVTSTTNVEVVSDYSYISDLNWKSAKTAWSTVMKDRALEGGAISILNKNNVATTYDKGVAAHANSEVVYNVEGKGYSNFESFIGIDQSVKGKPSSAIFEIWVDGVNKYTSKVFMHNTPGEFVKVNIEGASEVKLITNDAKNNGNTSDHTVWADAKFTTINSKPSLNIPANQTTKLGTPIDINLEYSATDIEDGNITSNIVVNGEVNFNKTGKYPISYTVTDSDGNEISETRIVAVVDMEDYKYLTDIDWKSTNNSYSAPNKDKAISGNKLRLTNENGEVAVYERGIGAHSTSTIVYDLTDKNYDYFTSYVGVDRAMFGTVGSVEFEVWADGVKLYETGRMNSTDNQKFIEVPITGTKELKLVVTDGGNGIGSDHATWGDTKLHSGIEGKLIVDYSILEETNNKAKAIQLDNYTSESINNLKAVIEKADKILLDKTVVDTEEKQNIVNSMVQEINNAIEALVKINLNEIVSIKDKYLKEAIKKELKIATDNITIGDMLNLNKLVSDEELISSLEGLQYAKNLVELNLTYNKITDLSPIKDLKNLENFNVIKQFKSFGVVNKKENNTIVIDENIINRDGNRLKPNRVRIVNNGTGKYEILDLNKVVNGHNIIVDFNNLVPGAYSINVDYENEEGNYQIVTMYTVLYK